MSEHGSDPPFDSVTAAYHWAWDNGWRTFTGRWARDPDGVPHTLFGTDDDRFEWRRNA